MSRVPSWHYPSQQCLTLGWPQLGIVYQHCLSGAPDKNKRYLLISTDSSLILYFTYDKAVILFVTEAHQPRTHSKWRSFMALVMFQTGIQTITQARKLLFIVLVLYMVSFIVIQMGLK